MNIAVFLTFGYSLKTWQLSGTLDRELKVYKELHDKFGVKFTLFSYGDNSDKELLNNYSCFELITLFDNKTSLNKINKLIYSCFLPIKYYKKLKNFDVLHQHQLLGTWVVLLSKLLLRKPVLIRTGYDMYEFAGYSKGKFSLIRWLFYLLTYFSIYFCDLYTVTSECDRTFLSKNFKINNKKILLRPNWIIPSNIKPLELRESSKLITIGRLDKQKNYLELIKQFPHNSELELLIVGDGNQKEILKREIIKNKYRVTVKSKLDNDKLIHELNNYKYYISTSLYEGNPKTLLEAMSCGCIVIASNIKNHTEIIDQSNGVLFQLGDFDLTDIINNLEKNKSSQLKLSINAEKSVVQKNHLDKLVVNMYEDYKFLIK